MFFKTSLTMAATPKNGDAASSASGFRAASPIDLLLCEQREAVYADRFRADFARACEVVLGSRECLSRRALLTCCSHVLCDFLSVAVANRSPAEEFVDVVPVSGETSLLSRRSRFLLFLVRTLLTWASLSTDSTSTSASTPGNMGPTGSLGPSVLRRVFAPGLLQIALLAQDAACYLCGDFRSLAHRLTRIRHVSLRAARGSPSAEGGPSAEGAEKYPLLRLAGFLTLLQIAVRARELVREVLVGATSQSSTGAPAGSSGTLLAAGGTVAAAGAEEGARSSIRGLWHSAVCVSSSSGRKRHVAKHGYEHFARLARRGVVQMESVVDGSRSDGDGGGGGLFPIEDAADLPTDPYDGAAEGSATRGRIITCLICYASPAEEPASTVCGHVFCWECAAEWVNDMGNCPLCRTKCALNQLWPLQHFE